MIPAPGLDDRIALYTAYLNSDVVAAVETQGRAVRVALSSSVDVSVTMIPAK